MKACLVHHCAECGAPIDVPTGSLSLDRLTSFLSAAGWFLSVVTPPGEPEVRMVVVCGECIRVVHPPAVVDLAKHELKKRRS